MTHPSPIQAMARRHVIADDAAPHGLCAHPPCVAPSTAALSRAAADRLDVSPELVDAVALGGRTIDDRAGEPAGRAPDRSGRSAAAAGVCAAPGAHGSFQGGPTRCMGDGATALAKPAEDFAP